MVEYTLLIKNKCKKPTTKEKRKLNKFRILNISLISNLILCYLTFTNKFCHVCMYSETY